MRHGSRRSAAAITILATILLLSGCEGIPHAGPVQEGLTDLEQAEQQVQYSPDMPVPGANEEEIVRGFVQAASSASEDYAIARQFLTRNYSAQWDPSATVLVDDGSRKYRVGKDGISILSLSGIAVVDDRGILAQIAPGEDTEVTFEVLQEEGEWRISAAPNGVILDRTTFFDVWSQHQIFFGSVVNGQLVADSRWFLNRATMSTNIVNELLAGSTEILQDTAVNAFPAGTSLTTEAVIVEAGTARIELSKEFETADAAALELATEQLGTSLNSVPGVTHFTVTVEQAEVISEAVMAPQTAASVEASEASFDPGVIKDGQFGYLNPTGFNAKPEFYTELSELNPRSITMSADQKAVAVLASDGVTWVTSDEIVPIDLRTGLLAPTVDRFGYVWTAQKASPQFVSVTMPGEVPLELTIPWLQGQTVADLRVSPDGHKLAALMKDDGGSRVVVGSIGRETTGEPRQVADTPNNTAFWAAGSPIDLDWIDSLRLAALTQSPTTGTRITTGGPGFFAEDRAAVADAVALRGGGRENLIRVLNAEGEIWGPQGTSGWQRQSSGYSLLTKRG